MTETRKIGIIIVHGFGGNTKEIEPLSTLLKQEGFPVLTPELKGHTGLKKAFKHVTYQDWIADVEKAYLDLKSKGHEIVLIGFSMGGLLSLQIASKYKVRGIITLNTPFKIRSGIPLKTEHLKSYIQTMFRLPLSAYFNFMKLLSETKKILSSIKCDLSVNQAKHDDVVHFMSAKFLHDHVASPNRELHYYDHSDHLILYSSDAKEVMKNVLSAVKAYN